MMPIFAPFDTFIFCYRLWIFDQMLNSNIFEGRKKPFDGLKAFFTFERHRTNIKIILKIRDPFMEI